MRPTLRGTRTWTTATLAVAVAVASSACSAKHVKDTGAGSSTVADGYEVIVVGSGAGGGPLAARLARAGKRVLLLEAGRDVGDKAHYRVPAQHALATEDPDLAWWYFVHHHADPSVDAADTKWTKDGALYPRGSALGGSTAVNAMVTALPSRADWNRLAELTGDASYRAVAMDAAYDRVREWLDVEVPDPRLALGDRRVSSFLLAAAQVFGDDGGATGPAVDASMLGTLLGRDLNVALRGGETTGVFRLPLATRDGQRNGTRERLLDTVAAGFPLTIVTGAFVTRALWDTTTDPPTALGVEYVQQDAVYGASLAKAEPTTDRQRAYASREIVLSAGAFNSPQLLMLSGVGDPATLDALGIAPVVARPGVGKNLQDRVEASVVTEFAAPLDVLARCRLGEGDDVDPCLREWERGQGVYRTPGFLATVLMRSSPAQPLADLQVFAVPTDARGYYPGYARDSAAAKDRFSWLLLKAHTGNRDGVVSLVSADPFARPSIAFNDFDERAPLEDPDLLALVAGVRFVRKLEDRMQTLVADDRVREISPGAAVQTDAELAAWLRRQTWGHHACCTDKMGDPADPDAVVDARFRVIGAAHLRVVDASVFPEIPGTFIALPSYMLAEHAAAVIAEDLR